MYKRSEGFFKGYQDLELFFQIWEQPQARGTVIFTHGQGEHSESYHRLIEGFTNDAWSFYGWDLRGHGRSAGKRGYAAEFDDYCKDYRLFIDQVVSQEKVKKGPVVLYCHSMGGLIELKTLIRHPDLPIDAIVVSAPLLGLSMPVPGFKAAGAGVLNRVMPTITLHNEVSNNMLTHDLDVIREFEQDPLRHNRVSPGVFLGILDSIEYVKPRAVDVKKPALFILPENDPVVSTPASREFFEKLGSKRKEIYVYPNTKHELINETNRQTVYADIKKFLDSVLESRA